MHCYVWLLLFLRGISPLLYDSGYIPMLIAPNGYSIWESSISGVYTSVLEPTEICQLRVKGDWIYLNIFDPKKAIDHWNPTYMYSKYKGQEPTLCFVYKKKPAFIMRDEEDSSTLFVFNETQLQEYRFRMNYDLLAFDCITEEIYVYDSDYLYKFNTNWLVHKMTSNSEKIYLSMKPTMKTIFENWTDMFAVENIVYFLNDKEMYIIVKGREHLLGFYNSDTFNHTLVPTYERVNGIRMFDNHDPFDPFIVAPPRDEWILPNTTSQELETLPKIVRIEYEDVQRANSFPEIFISDKVPNTKPFSIFIVIVFLFQVCVVVCYIIDYFSKRNYKVVRSE